MAQGQRERGLGAVAVGLEVLAQGRTVHQRLLDAAAVFQLPGIGAEAGVDPCRVARLVARGDEESGQALLAAGLTAADKVARDEARVLVGGAIGLPEIGATC